MTCISPAYQQLRNQRYWLCGCDYGAHGCSSSSFQRLRSSTGCWRHSHSLTTSRLIQLMHVWHCSPHPKVSWLLPCKFGKHICKSIAKVNKHLRSNSVRYVRLQQILFLLCWLGTVSPSKSVELAGPLTFFAFFAFPSHHKTALSAGLPREALSSMMGLHRKQVVTFLTIESQAVILYRPMLVISSSV